MIENRATLERSQTHALALDCLERAVAAAAPEAAIRSNVTVSDETLSIVGTEYDLTAYRDVFVVGGGKAASGVVTALESILGDHVTDGLVVTKHPTESDRVRCVTGDHPLPSERNVRATAELLALVAEADAETLVVPVVTGGTSALLTAPAGDLSLTELRETTALLLDSGAPIDEINAVRKHLSESKGGRLAAAAAPATVATLVLSDVVGNDLSAIGSGPTVPDETTYGDALAVLERYDVTPPEAVAAHLAAGDAGRRSETPTTAGLSAERVQTHLVGDNALALDAARDVAREAGYTPLVVTSRLRGEAREAGTTLLAVAEEIAATGDPVEPPAVVLAGGECTVSITSEGGTGGPNQELALSAGIELTGETVVAAVDSDGEDGSSAVAGALVDAETVTDRAAAREALATNDAGRFLSEADATIRTGPTGTNVNDVVVLVVPDSA